MADQQGGGEMYYYSSTAIRPEVWNGTVVLAIEGFAIYWLYPHCTLDMFIVCLLVFLNHT